MGTSRWFVGALSLGAVLCRAPASWACGGCVYRESPVVPVAAETSVQVVTDHRMVLSLSSRRTTLWDQIQYAGRPEEFAWVLPLFGDASSVELATSSNAFVDALDALTAPRMIFDALTCRRADGTFQTRPIEARQLAFGADHGELGGPVAAPVGPYQTLVLDADPDGDAAAALAGLGYRLPAPVQEVVRDYGARGARFLVLRLRPGFSQTQMVPVRVSFDGYQPRLPLRMVQAGVADRVALTLMVVADSTVRVQGSDELVIDGSALTYDPQQRVFNYLQVFDALVRALGPYAWVTQGASALPGDARERLGDEGARLLDGLAAPRWTRLRTELSRGALDRDLVLEASDQGDVPYVHTVPRPAGVGLVSSCPAPRGGDAARDTGAATGAGPAHGPLGFAPTTGPSCTCRAASGRGSAAPWLFAAVAWAARRRRARGA